MDRHRPTERSTLSLGRTVSWWSASPEARRRERTAATRSIVRPRCHRPVTPAYGIVRHDLFTSSGGVHYVVENDYEVVVRSATSSPARHLFIAERGWRC